MTAPKLSRNSGRFTFNPRLGVVHVGLYARKGGRRVLASSLTLRRADLRLLCDMLHDYADHLDRQDREATQ
ncbi:hypothetical protein [Microbacterium sp. HJ5]